MSDKRYVVPDGVIVDESDIPVLTQYRWRIVERFGYKRVLRRTRNRKLGKQLQFGLAEELIGKKLGLVIDHINGNPLDNRRSNLRHCTQAENMRNRKVQRNQTGHKGIYLTPYGTYTASLWLNGKSHSSNHKTIESAIAARKNMESLYHGEFTRKA